MSKMKSLSRENAASATTISAISLLNTTEIWAFPAINVFIPNSIAEKIVRVIIFPTQRTVLKFQVFM